MHITNGKIRATFKAGMTVASVVEAGCWVALAATPSAIGSCGVRFGAANNILVYSTYLTEVCTKYLGSHLKL